MTTPESIQTIAAWGGLVASAASVLAVVVNVFVLFKVEKVRHATNSLTDRLVATTKVEAHAAGVKEEKDRAGKS